MKLGLLHIITALSLLFSTTGIKVSFHYCEDALSGLALFKEASSCHEAGNEKSCCASHEQKDNCCDTDTEVFQQDIDKYQSTIEFSDIDFPAPMAASPESFTDWSALSSICTYKFYRPPPRIKDIPVLFETFLC